MVNTYTNAGLVKQEYDTNDDTWGDYENTNKDIQQSLIAGYLGVSLASGDVTLTDVDGANDQGKYHIFATTGLLTGNTNLIVPTKSRHFKVRNSCTGNYTVTVKTAAGTGIVVPQGKIADLICDGTNVIAGTTYLQGAQFQNSSQTISTVASSGSAQTVTISTANMWIITLTGNCTITLSGAAASGVECQVRVRLIQDGTGGRTVSFSGGTFKWLGQTTQSSAPTFTTTAGYISEVVFRTVDGGTTYTAQLVGSGSSSGGGGSVSPVVGTYVAVGSSGKVSSSTDGSTWTLQATQFSGATIIGCDLYNGRFHFYRNGYLDPDQAGKYTTNGTSFTAWGTGGGQVWIKSTGLCTNGNAVPLDVFQTNASNNYTTNGWTSSGAMSGSAFSTSKVYYGAINGNDVLWVADQGFVYSQSGGTASTSASLTGVTMFNTSAVNFLNGVWLIGDVTGQIVYKSTVNGAAATLAHTMTGGNQPNKFIYTGTKWIAVGNAGKISNAASIGSWTARTSGLSGNIVDVANNGAIVVCVTDIGEVARSADDGDSWAVLSTPTNNPFGGSALYFIKFRLTNFWAGGAGGKLGASPDGLTFSLVTSGFSADTIYDMEAA